MIENSPSNLVLSDPDYRSTLQEKSRIQQELKARAIANPLEFYWPHVEGCDGQSCTSVKHTFVVEGESYTIEGCPQYFFHTNLADTRAFFGGNRSGKTTAGAVEIGFHTTGFYPNWYPKLRRYKRPTKGRVFAQDFKKGVGEVITPAIDDWFPKGAIKDKSKNNQGIYDKYWIKHETGKMSVFDILSYEQESKVCEGWSGDWVWFDEPPPREHRVATARGLTDKQGWEIFTLTPLSEPWLYDEIYESQNPKVYSVVADIRHNLYRLNPLSGQHIGLAPEAIEKYEQKLTPEERQVRIHGKFRHLSGLIFKVWNRKVHTFSRNTWKAGEKGVIVDGEPPKSWTRCFLIDPHDRNPMALLWVAKDPEYGRLFVYREAWLKEHIFRQAVEHIRDREIEAHEKVNYRIMDPNFGPKNQANTGKTVRETFEEEARDLNYPMRFAFANDRKELGRKRLTDALWYDTTKPISIINRPDIMVADDLTNCIYQMEHYIWAEYKLSDRDPKEEPKDINTHFPDLMQYLVLVEIQDNPPEVVAGFGHR